MTVKYMHPEILNNTLARKGKERRKWTECTSVYKLVEFTNPRWV